MNRAVETIRPGSQGRRGLAPPGRRFPAGYGLTEMMVVAAIASVMMAAAIPRATMTLHEYRLKGAAVYLRSFLRRVRSRAAAESRYVGVVFEQGPGGPMFTVHRDGNGNGIRRRDIRSGVDPKIREPYKVNETFPGVRYGSEPTGVGVPSLPGLRIGRSGIVSFSPLGSSTSGTLFLSNRYGIVYAVIVYGATGRVRIARYRGGRWENQ